MKVLGAILAGGKSSRFGSDKAEAVVGSRRLIDHALEALRASVDSVVVCGRNEPGYTTLDDLPGPGLGPLGGLNAALQFAATQRFDAVLSAPVDVFPLPLALAALLGAAGPRYLGGQYAIGLWPTTLAAALQTHLAARSYSMRSWIASCDALPVDDSELNLRNINQREDFLALRTDLARAGNTPWMCGTDQDKKSARQRQLRR